MRQIALKSIFLILLTVPGSESDQLAKNAQQSGNSSAHPVPDVCEDRAFDLKTYLDSEYKPSVMGEDPTASGGAGQMSPVPKDEDGRVTSYLPWLNQDAVYLITPEERRAFLSLHSDAEFERFVENFWRRRNPDPDSEDNTFETEVYRRIAFANEEYGLGMPGWKSDRGRIYITWGPPDSIEAYPKGVPCPANGGLPPGMSPPFEVWKYRYLEGIGEFVEIPFEKKSYDGEFIMSKKARRILEESMSVWMTVNAGSWEGQLGAPSKLDFLAPSKPPEIRFKDLETLATANVVRNGVPITHEEDSFYGMDNTTLTLFTLRVPKPKSEAADAGGEPVAGYEVFGRVRDLSGRVVATFEESVPDAKSRAQFFDSASGEFVIQRILPIRPEAYELELAAKNLQNGAVGVSDSRIAVGRPRSSLGLSGSSLVLADRIEKPSAQEMDSEDPLLGAYRIVPHEGNTFKADEPISVFWQIYGVTMDPASHENDARIFTSVWENDKQIWSEMETTEQSRQRGNELTIARQLPSGMLPRGNYTLRVEVRDRVSGQSIQQSASFAVD